MNLSEGIQNVSIDRDTEDSIQLLKHPVLCEMAQHIQNICMGVELQEHWTFLGLSKAIWRTLEYFR